MIIYSLWSIRHCAVLDQNKTLFTHLHVSEMTSTVKAYEVVGCVKRESEWYISAWGAFQLRLSSIKIRRYLHICTLQNYVNKLSSSLCSTNYEVASFVLNVNGITGKY